MSIPAGEDGRATVHCGSGERSVGGGIRVDGNLDEAYVVFTHNISDALWEGQLFNIAGVNKHGNGFAICTTRRFKDLFVRRKLKHRTREARVSCPQGMHVAGGGGGGTRNQDRLVSSYPFDSHDTGKAPDDGWAVVVHSSTRRGYIDVAANCVRSDRLKYRSGHKDITVDCPSGAAVTGGGMKHPLAAAPSTWINSLGPVDNLSDGDSTPDNGWLAWTRDLSESYRTYAVCFD